MQYRVAFCAAVALVVAACNSKKNQDPREASVEAQQRDASPPRDRTVTDVYDETYADVYDSIWLNPKRYEWELAEIEKTISIPKTEVRILDAGCGTGTHYVQLSKSYDVRGLDISEAMIRAARKKAPEGTFVVGDLRDRSLFEAGSFSHVMAMFEGTFYNEEFEQILANYNHWLRDEGILVIETFNPDEIETIDPAKPAPTDKARIFTKKTKGWSVRGWWTKGEGITATYHEEFLFADGTTRLKDHVLYLPRLPDLEDRMRAHGFDILEKKPTLLKWEMFYVLRKRAAPAVPH